MAGSLPAYTTLTRLYAGSTYIDNTKTIHKSCLVITESWDLHVNSSTSTGSQRLDMIIKRVLFDASTKIKK